MIGEFGNGKTPKVLSGSPKIATTVKEGQNQNLLLRNIYKWYIYTVNNASNLRNIVWKSTFSSLLYILTSWHFVIAVFKRTVFLSVLTPGFKN